MEIGEAVEAYRKTAGPAALTGAGISVGCGIPDFRSPGGLWTVFDPEQYATLETFLTNPAKAWRFYRALGETLHGRRPGPAHLALAELELAGLLQAVITQNIDGLHTAAGSRNVLEVHGNHSRLQCLSCGSITSADPFDLRTEDVPRCRSCSFPLKPDVVLFGEWVREMDRVGHVLSDCDFLLVIGTSAAVFPVGDFPFQVLARGGKILEFNLIDTFLTPHATCVLRGPADETVPAFVRAILGRRGELP